jgi:hypothetical protein
MSGLRWRTAVAASALLAVTTAGPAIATHSEGTAPTRLDFTSGSGEGPLGETFGEFTWFASSGPNGEDPTGQLERRNTALVVDIHFHAVVTCLRVQGNIAVFRATITRSDLPAQLGTDRLVIVVDNGPPVGGLPVDFASVAATPGAPNPLVCPEPAAPDTLNQMSAVVHDAP